MLATDPSSQGSQSFTARGAEHVAVLSASRMADLVTILALHVLVYDASTRGAAPNGRVRPSVIHVGTMGGFQCSLRLPEVVSRRKARRFESKQLPCHEAFGRQSNEEVGRELGYRRGREPR